ncbi:hypothetical protein TNCV_11361, partial [Trichonephila clavipes]
KALFYLPGHFRGLFKRRGGYKVFLRFEKSKEKLLSQLSATRLRTGIYIHQQLQPGGCQASTQLEIRPREGEKQEKTPQSLGRTLAERNWLGKETQSVSEFER